MNLFVDDVRNPPDGWRVARTIEDAKLLLATGEIERCSLDHDMGACAECITRELHVGDMRTDATTYVNWCPHYEDGTRLVYWMVQTNTWPKIKPTVHSANPVGRERMCALIDRYFPESPNENPSA